ncbi:hypothetical protein SRHO_G00068550 [Serrasalmus rhombeus]
MAPLWLGRLCLLLLLCITVLSQTAERSKRKKREWILPAAKLVENVDYTKNEFIAKIWSDKHTEDKPLEYSLTGHGADKEPYNLFLVNPQNGWVRITGILDREERSEYNLKGLARYRNASLAEGEVHLKIKVVDQNDNPPKFTFSKETRVMRIRAEDADEQGTINAKIAYSIVKQIPEGAGPMFSIDRDTGDIYVKEHTLDRETLDSYTVIVQGVDMDGAPNGNTGTGTVEIKVLDINDNVPTLEKDEHTGRVDEDVADAVVMRIKALDKDQEYTDNWLVHFTIIEGNEDELFTIETDPKTNEGILKLVKRTQRKFKFLKLLVLFLLWMAILEKVLKMSDVPPRTVTGTIALKVEDSNDHCPRLTSNYESICSDTKIINVTALDQDIYPNAEPYKFVLVEEETHGEWEMVPVNGTTVSFHAKDLLWPGFYELTVEIFDMQGLGCEDKQKLQVEVCTCEEGDTCVVALRSSQQHASSVKVGVPAIGLLMASLALLILVPMLLLVCQCGVVSEFTELPFDAKEQLISYHTEGKGEDKEVPLLSAPDQQSMAVGGNAGSKVPMMAPTQAHEWVMEIDSMLAYQNNTFSAEHHGSNLYSSSFRRVRHDLYGGIALPDNFLHEYFTQKARHAAENPPLTDSLLAYSCEDQDSPVGSLGCCSLLESGSDMTFLSDLGPKFMTLAEICSPSKPSPPPTKVEQIVKPKDTTFKSECSVTTSTAPFSEPVPPLPEQSKEDSKDLNNSDTLSTMITSPKQLVQQQPMYYLVEHQVPRTVIIAERPTQGTYLINGSGGARGLILQDSNKAQASLQQGLYLISETSMLQEHSIDSISNPSSPRSPTSPTIWVQGSQSCFPHHDTVSQRTLPETQRVILLQSEGNVIPAVLSQTCAQTETQGIGSDHPVEAGYVMLVEDQNTLGPRRSTQAQAELQSPDSSLKFSPVFAQDRGPENAFMHQQGTLSFNQPEEAQAQLNTKEDMPQFRLDPLLTKGQGNMEFSKQINTDYTADVTQIPTSTHFIPLDLPLVRSTTADVLAKANAIRKELEETMLTEGFMTCISPNRQEKKSADDTSSVNDDFSAIETADLATKCQKEKKEDHDSESQGSEVEETNLTVRDTSVSQVGAGQNGTAKATIASKTEEADLNDSEEVGVTTIEMISAATQEIICEQRLLHRLEEETEYVASQLKREDSPVTEQVETPAVELNDEIDQDLADASNVTLETPQDISGVILEVDTEAGVVTDFQVTLLTEEEELKPEQQNIEEVKENEDGPKVSVNASHLGGVRVMVEDSNSAVTQEAISEQSLLTLEVKLAGSDLEREDAEGELQLSMQMTEDTSLMEELETPAVDLNDESIQEGVEVEVTQDNSGVILEVDTEVEVVADFQVTLLTEEEELKLEQQNLDEVKVVEVPQNISGVNLEEDTEVPAVTDVQVALLPEVVKGELKPEPQNTEEVKENEHCPKQTGTKIKSDVGDQLQSSIRKTKDTPVMEQIDITEEGMKDELGPDLVETESDQRDPTNLQQSAPSDPESDKEADLEEVMSDVSECHIPTDLEQVLGMRQYIETPEVEDFQVQVSTGQMTPQATRQEQFEDNELTYQIQDSEEGKDLLGQEKYNKVQDINTSAAQADAKMTANTVKVMKSMGAGYHMKIKGSPETEKSGDDEVSPEPASADYVSLSVQSVSEVTEEIKVCRHLSGDLKESTDPSQSAFTNLKLVQDGLELENEVQQISPEVETVMGEAHKACTLQSLSEKGKLVSEVAASEISESLAQAERAGDVLSEVTEQNAPDLPCSHLTRVYKTESVCLQCSFTMDKASILVLLSSALVFCQGAPVDHGGSDSHCPLTVKILDAVKGVPAGNVALKVSRKGTNGTWEKISSGTTDIAGEVHEIITEQDFTPGVYRVEFDTKNYWKAEGRAPFHEVADVVFEAHAEGHRHYTLALLLSPFSYTTTAVVVKAHD